MSAEVISADFSRHQTSLKNHVWIENEMRRVLDSSAVLASMFMTTTNICDEAVRREAYRQKNRSPTLP